jgi:hypothetical protein
MRKLLFGVVLLAFTTTIFAEISAEDRALIKRDSIWAIENPNSLPIWETYKEKQIADKYFASWI